MAKAATCSKTPSYEQRVPYYCWKTKWEVGEGAEIEAGEGAVTGEGCGLLYFISWARGSPCRFQQGGMIFRKITLNSSVEDGMEVATAESRQASWEAGREDTSDIK